jgi:uncharacterized damage-inducible protein DinB
MNKKYLIELADYNIWANNLICEWLMQISEEQFIQFVGGSFKNIQETTLHIAAAEKIWQERLNDNVQEWLAFSFSGNKTELIESWNNYSQNLKQYIEHSSEEDLVEKFAFSTRDGTPYFMPRYQALAHVFNHSTYHRGQIVQSLRQVGFTNVGSTDMIGYYRKFS